MVRHLSQRRPRHQCRRDRSRFVESWPLYDAECSYDQVVRWIAANVERTGWLIFVTHDVQDEPTRYGTTPKLIESSVRAAIDAGCACLTVEGALERIRRSERGEVGGQAPSLSGRERNAPVPLKLSGEGASGLRCFAPLLSDARMSQLPAKACFGDLGRRRSVPT